jgi:hypothetical protein
VLSSKPPAEMLKLLTASQDLALLVHLSGVHAQEFYPFYESQLIEILIVIINRDIIQSFINAYI